MKKVVLLFLIQLLAAFGSLLVGGVGNRYIGIAALWIALLFWIYGIPRIHYLAILNGVIAGTVGWTSLYCYRRNIHDLFYFYHIFEGLHVPVWFQDWVVSCQKPLTAAAIACTIVLMWFLWEEIGMVIAVYYGFLSLLAGMIGFTIRHEVTFFVWPFFFVLFYLVGSSVLSVLFSNPLHCGQEILTVFKIPFTNIRYINGHYIPGKKSYKKKEWLNLSIEEKKQETVEKIKNFTSCLGRGSYLIETHEVLMHLLEKHLPDFLEMKNIKKYPAIFQSKSDSQFQLLYGEDWKTIKGDRKVYVWYFEVEYKIN